MSASRRTPTARSARSRPLVAISPAGASAMAPTIEIPVDLARFELPGVVQARLQALLDRQDAGQPLIAAERQEAAGLVDRAEVLSLLHLRAQRPTPPT